MGATGHVGRKCDGLAAERWGPLSFEMLSHLAAGLGSIDAIVHCAGGASVGPSLQDPALDFERTVGSTAHVLEFMRARAPQARLVFLSSAAVYGAANVEPLHEELPKRPMSPYGVHKAIAEDLVAHWGEQFGLNYTALRLFSVYGAGLRKQLLWELSRRALAGEDPLSLFGSGDERRDFIHVSDAAGLIVRAADPALSPPAIMNGGSGKGTTVRALAERLLSALDFKAALRFSGAVKAGDPTTMVADVTRASEFGFAPKMSLDDGLASYAAWVRREV